MIRLVRPPAPAVFASSALREMRAQVHAFYSRPAATRRQEKPDFPLFPRAHFQELLGHLLSMSHGKCAYCEIPLEIGSREVSLDRFRPKAGAVGLTRKFSFEHYWWLAYAWENLYPACATCNKIKGPKFPVEGQRIEVGAEGEALGREKRLLVDPCVDDPVLDLEFLRDGRVRASSRRGEHTIETLDLNRVRLVRQRRLVVEAVISELQGVVRGEMVASEAMDLLQHAHDVIEGRRRFAERWPELGRFFQANQPFLAAVEAEVKRWAEGTGEGVQSRRGATQSTAAQRRGIAPTKERTGVSAKARGLLTQVISRIAIRNYRGIQNVDLRIPLDVGSTAPWLILLGENGTGKSSILQAAALALSSAAEVAPLGVKPSDVLRHGKSEGSVKVWIGDTTVPRVLRMRRGSRVFTWVGPAFHPVLLGYGATRLLPRTRGPSATGRVRIANMFDPFRPLLDASRWLGRLDRPSFDYAARALKDVLGLPPSARLARRKRKGEPGVSLRLFGADLTLEQLSDGYQSVLGLTCDLMAGLRMTGTDALEAAEGLVVLDELGAHLHPRWRMRIVSSLRKAFPRVQFLVSTHDPLCLRGLDDHEAAVLRRTARGRVYPVPDLPSLRGLRVDQLLTSEFFGLDSTMDPAVEQAFRRLYQLLAVRNPTDKQSAEIVELREQLAPSERQGTTRRERRLLELLDSELARVDVEPDAGKREAIRRETDNRIAADLNRLLQSRPVLS